MEGDGGPAEPALPPQGASRPRGLIEELRRRNVFRVAAAYSVAAWLVVQVAATVAPAFGLPPMVLQAVIVLAVLGLFAVGVFAWRYDVTPLGLQRAAPAADPTPEEVEVKRRTARALTRFTLAVAALAVLATGAALALRTVGVGPLAPGRASLAVLPFADLSPERDQAYFAEGVAEEILSILADDPAIRVVGRTSAAQFKDRAADMQAIRETLDVSHLLEGSVRTQGGRLRMSVRLVRTSDGDQLWAETYDRSLSDVFAVQDEIGRVVAERLRGTLGRSRTARTSVSAPTGVDAYSLYLAARALMRQRREEPLHKARTLLRQAMALDPNYAPALAAYAEATHHLADSPITYGRIPEAQADAEARPYAERAIRLAPDKADGYAALALLQDGDAAIASLRRAIRLDPARGELMLWLGLALEETGRNAEALQALEAAYTVEPLWRVSVNRMVHTLIASGRWAEARAIVDRYERGTRDRAAAARWRGRIAHEQGDLSEAIRQFSVARALEPDLPYLDVNSGATLHALGSRAAAAGAIKPGRERILRLMYAGDLDAMAREVRAAGPTLRPLEVREAAAALAAGRRWADLLALYDSRYAGAEAFCAREPWSAVPFASALRAAGRAQEAAALLTCLERAILRERAAGVYVSPRSRSFVAMQNANLLALTGRRTEALDQLEQAIAHGWRGLSAYSASLRDMPGLDGLHSEPRFQALESRLAQEIAREHREVLALGLAPRPQPSQATRSPPP